MRRERRGSKVEKKSLVCNIFDIEKNLIKKKKYQVGWTMSIISHHWQAEVRGPPIQGQQKLWGKDGNGGLSYVLIWKVCCESNKVLASIKPLHSPSPGSVIYKYKLTQSITYILN